MWNGGNNNNFHRHPQDSQQAQQQQAQQQQQQQQAHHQQNALRRRLSLELAAAAYGGAANGGQHQGASAAGLLGAASFQGGMSPEEQLALAVAARQQQAAVEAALQEERNNQVALARQQQLELMALQHRQQAAAAAQQQQAQQALQELQRRSEMVASPAADAAVAVSAVAAAVASEFDMEDVPPPVPPSVQPPLVPIETKPVGAASKKSKTSGKKTSKVEAKQAVAAAVAEVEQLDKQNQPPIVQKEALEERPLPSRSPSPPVPQDDDPAQPIQQPRGKPEAMAKRLASAVRRQEILEELEAEQQQHELKQQQREMTLSSMDSLGSVGATVTGMTTPSSKTKSRSGGGSSSKKRKTPSGSNSSSKNNNANASTKGTGQPPAKKKRAPPKKKAPPKKSTGNSKSKSSESGGGGGGGAKKGGGGGGASSAIYTIGNSKIPAPTMDDPVDHITENEYGKLEALMEQFCRVPLLAEFSRPVSLLHPELMAAYTKIVEHPVDLGQVCRRIRRRQYENLRDVRLDAWRIFANCFKYHSHPSNKDAVPSFVSIALHLRDLFNDLWQEHILPSDFPPPVPTGGGRFKPQDPNAALRASMEQRIECRKKRLIVSGLSVMAGKCLERAAEALGDIIENGGLVDDLDTVPIWGEGVADDDDDESDLEMIVGNFRKLQASLREIITNNEELGVDELESSVRKCYTAGDGLESMSATLKIRIASRMDRYLGQLVVPIHEATCRGVSQSSIWGCMAAAVWARESSKKPFWPALVLGIIAPEDQKEDWHQFLTERNEARLPEKLKSQLLTGKRKAEQAVKKQKLGQADPQSFFLVEFLGSHEFIWVREADIVENFNADDDPNRKDTGGSRTKKVSRKSLANILGSKTYANAIEEAKWALEEFDLQLQDIGGAVGDDEDDEHEEGYSFSVLSQSDDEADGETDDDDITSESLDQDECNELLATNGLLDFSVAGRKRRAQILKQQKLNAEKKQKNVKLKKARADKAKKAKDEKQKEKEKRQEKRDLEKKRRKRMREREKVLKGSGGQNQKKRKLSEPAPGRRHQIVSKRERAEAIVCAYVSRTAKKGDYKPLGLNGEQRWIQSAVIDSTNLSGMALAFRAAAGLIPMPKQDTGASGKIVLMPWDKIRVRSKKTSAERTILLHQQIDLLQKEIKLRKASRTRRLKRLVEVEKEVAKINASVLEDDKLSRENPLKKSKKPHPLAGKKRKRPGEGAAASSTKAEKPKPTEASKTITTPTKSSSPSSPSKAPADKTEGQDKVKAENDNADVPEEVASITESVKTEIVEETSAIADIKVEAAEDALVM